MWGHRDRFRVFVHRILGERQNDVTPDDWRQWKWDVVERLNRYEERENEWQEIAIENRHCGPAEFADTRIGVPTRLKSLSPRDRLLTLWLDLG